MGVKYLHYTSRHLAQEIYISGRLIPRTIGGRIYLTQHTFPNGAEAARSLSILGKPIEVVCIIPEERVKDVLDNDGRSRHVEPIIAPDGQEIRPGCAEEYFTKPDKQIIVKGLDWFGVPIP